jgi:hypothetical protein
MKTQLFLSFAAGLVALLVVLNLVLSRWKFAWRSFALVFGYGLATGLLVAYATMFAGEVDRLAYALAALVVVAPFTAQEFLALAKRRGPPARSILGIVGLWAMMATPLLGPACIAVGAPCMTAYLIFFLRYPATNPVWLESIAREAAATVPGGCGYTPKPVTVPVCNRTTFLCGGVGLSVYARRDRTIVQVDRKMHARLGAPNLELFARELAERLSKADRAQAVRPKGERDE